MRTVTGPDGTRYVVRERRPDVWVLTDPSSGETTTAPPEDLTLVDGVDPLEIAASAVANPLRTLVLTVPDERALGLLVELRARGPTPVRTIVEWTDRCESDLHGLLTSLRAAGVIEETTRNGTQAYALTDDGATAIDELTQ